MKTKVCGQQGSILLITLMFLVVLTILTTVFLNTIIFNVTNSNVQSNMLKAFYMAEAGLAKAKYYLNNTAPDNSTDGSWRTSAYPTAAGNDPFAGSPTLCTATPTAPCEEILGEGSYTIWVQTFNSNKIKITSTGNFNGINRTVQQQFSITTPLVEVDDTWKDCGQALCT